MKQIFTCIALFSFISLQAQEPLILQPMKTDSVQPAKKDTSWKTSGFFGLNFSATALNDWQGGGQNNIAGNAILNLQAVYKKGKVEWLNKLDAQYGILKVDNSKLFKKNIDQLFALSKYNINAFGKYWYYAAQADYRTQFAPAYTYAGDSIVGRATSDINSPGYIQIALGLDFKPNKYFSATIAPLAGKITIVNRQYLADAGAFGVDKAVVDTAGKIVTQGKKSRFEFGGRVIVKFKKDIFKNVNLDSYLDLFSNYANKPGNIDVVFNNLLTIKINKYISANIISQMLYDDDVITVYDWNQDGKFDNPNDKNGPRVQLLSTFAIGFGYKF